MRRANLLIPLLLLTLASAQADITSPKAFFGHEICEDHWLANYQQLNAYWKLLDKESGRIKVVSIGKTEEGREQLMAIISEPRNLRNLESIRRANEKLARAKDLKQGEGAQLAKRGKAIVWIDGGLHASEVLGAQQLLQTAYELVSREDEENKRILRDCVILLVHANPDGMDLVSDWYMRPKEPKERTLEGVPRLYQKYAGHDNNRDFFASNLAETRNMNRVLYQTWYPQIVYNHHQSAPSGTIMFIPPFRSPFNFHVDPLAQVGIDLAGLHMHQRLIGEGMGGTVMRNGAPYSGWWNGGLRTTTYFHNMIGLLTETWGSPNPAQAPFIKDRQIPTGDIPKPLDVRLWHLRDSLQYEVSANYAVLDYASRYRERLLSDFHRMAVNSIERASRDHWTRYPSRINELGQASLSKPELRDARAYVLPSDQPDFATATKFVEMLMRTGIEGDTLQAKTGEWPAGSYVVRCDQAFRPHVLDMFEPQDYPNDFQYPGGPPIRPYDNAGYTLAFQMGVVFDRVLDPVEMQLKPAHIEKAHGEAIAHMSASLGFQNGPAHVSSGHSPAGWIGGAAQNDSFRLAAEGSRLGIKVMRTMEPLVLDGLRWPTGSFIIGNPGKDDLKLVGRLISGHFYGISAIPESAVPIKIPRIGLWDRYGGSMPSGWMRFVFEQFGLGYEVLFAPDLDAGGLRDKFDALVFVGGAIPARDVAAERPNPLADDPTIPFALRQKMGSISIKRTLPELRKFVEAGGQLIAIGSSALNLARAWELPVESALVETDAQGQKVPLPNTKFYIPGSILRMKVNPGPLTLGLPGEIDVVFDGSPAFRITDPAMASAVGIYDSDKPLRSGWAWGQAVLKDTAAIVDLPLGKGHVVLVGPEINFRGQSHGAFKLLFNALFRGG